MKRCFLLAAFLLISSCVDNQDNHGFPPDNHASKMIIKNYKSLERLANLMIADDYANYTFFEDRTLVSNIDGDTGVEYNGENKDEYLRLYDDLKVGSGGVKNGDIYFYAGAETTRRSNGEIDRNYALDVIRYFEGSPSNPCKVTSFDQPKGGCQRHIKEDWYVQYIWLGL